MATGLFTDLINPRRHKGGGGGGGGGQSDLPPRFFWP